MNESKQPRPPTLLQASAFAAVYLIWGSTYLAIRIAVATMPPLLLAGSRFFLAGTVLFALMRALGVRAPTRSEWLHAGVSGLLMATLGNGLVTLAEEKVPSNLTALLIACVPFFVAVLDWLRPGGVRPSPRVVVGVGLGLVGMALLVLPGRAESRGQSAWGLVAVLGAGLSWALGILYARHRPRHPSAFMASGQQMLVGGALLLFGAALHGELRLGVLDRATPEAWWAFGYLTICGSLIAFSAFAWLNGFSSASSVSTVAYVNPVVAVLLGWWILDETLTPIALWGAVLVVGAVVVMSVDLKAWRRTRAA